MYINWRIITYTTHIKAMTAQAEWRVSYGLETWEFGVVFSGKSNEFSLVRNVRNSCWVHPACCPICTAWAFIQDRWPGRDTNHQIMPSTKVRILCNYTSNPPYVFIVWCLLKCRVIHKERLGRWGLLFRTACTECNETKLHIHEIMVNCITLHHSFKTKTTRAFYKNHPVQEKIYSHPQKTKCQYWHYQTPLRHRTIHAACRHDLH